jgi:hypothetical protein
MATPIDSTTIVSTGNAVVQVLNMVWPVVASIIVYILGHKHTSRTKKITIPKV